VPRPPPPTLLERIRDPGFTPRLRDVDALVDLLPDDDLTKDATRALGRLGGAALAPLQSRLDGAEAPLRAHIVKAIGRLAPDEQAIRLMLAALTDDDPKSRRNAAIALGHVPRPDVEDALLLAWDRDPRPEMRRTIAASLGKSGSARALPLLREAAASTDPELARIGDRARVMVERTGSRGAHGRIDPTRSPSRPIPFVALSRAGLEDLVADELAAVAAVVEPEVEGPGRVRARLAGSIAAVFAARTILGLEFPLPPEPRRKNEGVAQTVARVLAGDAARRIFATWTDGEPRYRIAWAEGSHRRAATWETARAIGAAAPGLVNDPTASTWTVSIAHDDDAVEVLLAPRSLDDPRFVWRKGDVPAASHPTIAAALARVAGVREDDVVWDPFVGSGAELVERSLLGPVAALYGSDVDPKALGVAEANLAAAGLTARLERRDALEVAPPGVTLIITNPPMGRRLARTPGLDDMLDRFVTHAAAALEPRGRLVWMSPWPRRSRDAAARAGLRLDWSRPVDMGGFEAELQRWIK
jgi:23S rRNA G2445 N2-methylase RlmL